MAEIVVLGAGVVGLGTAMLLAKDGHDVTVLERDATPRAITPDEAWERWERRGVNQFRLPHYFLARYRSIVDAELPEVARSIEGVGGLRHNPLLEIPEDFRGPARPEDADLEVLTGRRPVVELAVAAAAELAQGVTVRRGTSVAGLLAGAPSRGGIPHVVGVRTESGDELGADLVVDLTGRRSAMSRWLEELGAEPPVEELEDSGFMYFGRHYRSEDGTLPFALGGGIQHFGTISSLTLPADNGTWGLGIVTNAKDRALLGLRDVGRWESVFGALPTVAHWMDGTPIDDKIVSMSKIEDRIRTLHVDGSPIATGVVAVGDAWACSNPSLGRGASLGMLHALLLRDVLGDVGLDDPFEFASTFAASTDDQLRPWFEWTRATDRHRLGQVDAGIAGEPYEPHDEDFELEQSLARASSKDPDLLRVLLRGALVFERPRDALARLDLFDLVSELGGGWRDEPVAAPTRDELLRLAST
jgi:2-polyprenyl-6-methoxyphenol hydroxylase-like FAD-dependent oxidoreductase